MGNPSAGLTMSWLSFFFSFLSDVIVTVAGFGEVVVDISYGGAFYAFVSAQSFGLDVTKSKTRDLVDVATAVTNAVKSQVRNFYLYNVQCIGMDYC